MPDEKMEAKYNEGNLKEYSHWILTVSFRQTTLGSYIILAKRPVERITDLYDEELLELKHVMRDIESALLGSEVFQPDRFNYLQLGNSLHQLHFHGIPRYSKPREFAGKTWLDTRYGTTPIIIPKEEESSLEVILQIREELLPLIKDSNF